MKVITIFGLILLVIVIILVFLLFSAAENHKNKLNQEYIKYPPPGQMIRVNNHNLHVYSIGQGNITLVFLAGHGTCCPIIDFKPLWMRLKNDYKIVIVERAGYGWSEASDSPRDIDALLAETRNVLGLSGEKGPYILVAHSMSGLEAVYWAQRYPDEIKAIIGIDPSVPDFVENYLAIPPKIKLSFMYLISRIGLSRYMSKTELEKSFPLIKSEDLSTEDKKMLLALFYKSSYTKNMLNEIDYLTENAKKVKANKIPVNTPMYFFISDGKEVTDANCREILTDYISQIAHGKYKLLDSGHYIHSEKPEILADEIKKFIGNIFP
ncbi:MAG: alpha/beta hydrolase [Atribacterota bacterium]|nr:alpha/beta hydrolase [Atribacterota bacterium]